jgi:hypothetical protein
MVFSEGGTFPHGRARLRAEIFQELRERRLSLQRLIGSGDRSPHVRDRTAVVSQPFFRLLEVPPDNIHEGIDRDDNIRIKGVQVVHGHEARVHVPFMFANRLVGCVYVGRRNIVRAEQFPLQIGVLIPHRRIGKIPQRLMITNREYNSLRNVRLE